MKGDSLETWPTASRGPGPEGSDRDPEPFVLGRRQVVRHRPLEPAFGGSNPPAPATITDRRSRHHEERVEGFFGQRAPRPCAGGLRLSETADGAVASDALQRRRGLLPDPGERPRNRRLRHPADVSPRQREHHGTADRGGCAQALVRRSHHGGGSVLRVRAPGSEGQASRPRSRRSSSPTSSTRRGWIAS